MYTFVRVEGIEPSRLSAPGLKSGVAANYTIPACPRLYVPMLRNPDVEPRQILIRVKRIDVLPIVCSLDDSA